MTVKVFDANKHTCTYRCRPDESIHVRVLEMSEDAYNKRLLTWKRFKEQGWNFLNLQEAPDEPITHPAKDRMKITAYYCIFRVDF